MGTWGVPNTTEKAILLEEMMGRPVVASEVVDRLYDVLGNDTLWDLLDEVRAQDPEADVRPLIAAHLEEMTRWSIPSDFARPWEPGVRTRLEFLASGFADSRLPPMKSFAVQDDGDGRSAAEHLTGALFASTNGDRLFRGSRIAPGVYALFDVETEKLFRVECRYGLMQEAREEIKDDLMREFFDDSAPRMN